MVWEAVSAIVGVSGLFAGAVGFLAKREANRVLAPRVECASYLEADRKSVSHMYKVGGENAEHWVVESVRVTSAGANLAPMIDTTEDGYGNTLRAPEAWDTYLDLAEYDANYGILTAPADQPVHLIFTLSAKSDFNIRREAPVLIRAQTQIQ